ncbi:MAG: hypothetical protein AAFY72_11640 [Cyanobacteria bacterium J06649_4]
MKNIRNYFSSLASILRSVAIAAACALVVFSSATPAMAFGNSSSEPSDGLAQMDSVQEKSESTISGAISSDNGTKSVMKNSEKGLNGVQGSANAEKMISPEDANATSVESKIEDALDEVTP